MKHSFQPGKCPLSDERMLLKPLSIGDSGTSLHCLNEGLKSRALHSKYHNKALPLRGFGILYERNSCRYHSHLEERIRFAKTLGAVA